MYSSLRLFIFCLMATTIPMCIESVNPFTFLIRSTRTNPVAYLHSFMVNQLIDLPCYENHDGRQFRYSNASDMAWYRKKESNHYVKTFPTISSSEGHLIILEPIIGYNWYLCDTALKEKLKHANGYEHYYAEFQFGKLNVDWNFYQDFVEFDKGQFKHFIFTNELAITEIFIFFTATIRMVRADSSIDIESLTKPVQMGVFKLTLIKILDADCRLNVERYCESPTIDTLVPKFSSFNSISMEGKLKLILSNERLLKLGQDDFVSRRERAIRMNLLRWNMTEQSIDLGALDTLNPHPLSLSLIITSSAQIKSDCVGSGSYLSVKYDWQCVLCRPGFFLKNEPWIHAASEKNSICHLCPVGTYSSSWGSIKCAACPSLHTTRQVGSTKQSECLRVARHELENSLHDFLSYFGISQTDDYAKVQLLAFFLALPWILFLFFAIVSHIYGHDGVKDSEKRFQLEKELGLIILTIRRSYNALLDESMRL